MGNSSTKALEEQVKILDGKLKQETKLKRALEDRIQKQAVNPFESDQYTKHLNQLEHETATLEKQVIELNKNLQEQQQQNKLKQLNGDKPTHGQQDKNVVALQKQLREKILNLDTCKKEIVLLCEKLNNQRVENEESESKYEELIIKAKKEKDALLKKIKNLRDHSDQIQMHIARKRANSAVTKCKAIFEEIHMCMDEFAFICVSGGVHSHQQRLQMDLIRRVLLMVGTLKELFHNCFFKRREQKSDTSLDSAQMDGVILEACIDLFGMWDLCNDLFQHKNFQIHPILTDSIKDLDDAIKQLKDLVQPLHYFSANIEGLEKALLKDLRQCKETGNLSLPEEFSYNVRGGFYRFLKDHEICTMRDEIKKYVQSVIDAVLPPWEWVVKLRADRVISETHEVKISVVVLSKREQDWSCEDEISQLSERKQKIAAIQRFMGVNDYEHMHVLLEKYGTVKRDVGVSLYRFLMEGQDDPKLRIWHSMCVQRLGPREGTLEKVCKILKDLPAQRT